MALVVCDSSTLIHLTSIGRLALLKAFYEQITIPPAVWNEVVEQGAGRAGATEVAEARGAGWINVVAPADEALIHLLKRDLDDGESEVIALAVERQADLILLDESEARRIAKVTSWTRLESLECSFEPGARGSSSRCRQRSTGCRPREASGSRRDSFAGSWPASVKATNVNLDMPSVSPRR